MKAYLALIKIDLKLALRQRSVIFFNYLFPLIFFFVFAQAFNADQGGVITQVVTMVAVIGILGNGLFGAGMRAVQERENNILRRYKVAPISAAPLLVASMVTGLLTYLPYIVLMLLLAHFRYGMVFPRNVLSILMFASFGLVAFRSLGLTVASVVNSMQESAILTQVLYLSMLFLSGASFPLSMFPKWLMTVTQFIPATYLVSGLQSIMLRGESILRNVQAVGALCLTTAVALFVSVKLFRWEKEEKIRMSAKLWLLAVLAPFIGMGTWQAWSQENVVKTKILARELNRSRSILIRNVRIFSGDGKVIENGAVLIRNGKIDEVYEGKSPDPKVLKAEVIEGAGKTVLPGLIDVHVHLLETGGFSSRPPDYEHPEKQMQRELAAYLFSGITAVKSAGDFIDPALKVRSIVNSGEKLGAQLFVSGPLFTTAGGHGTEEVGQMPASFRAAAAQQFLRTPKTALEARSQVEDLKRSRVDGIKIMLDGGAATFKFNRLDPALVTAIAAEARAQNLPVVIHTGDLADVFDALTAGVNGIEHGSYREALPDATFAAMQRLQVSYDPTLSAAEAFQQVVHGDLSLLNRPLVLQAVPQDVVAETRRFFKSSTDLVQYRERARQYPLSLDTAKANLVRAWKAGVMLVAGSDAGSLLVVHGPTVQRELELWVQAGIPTDVALQAATWNAARLLRADNRFGAIRKGLEATLVVVDGNPLADIRALSSITSVILKGERVGRSALFEDE
jgi:imidazolonepropionase-like amidohydrolase/ABC-type multidrug transport system permease subunit